MHKKLLAAGSVLLLAAGLMALGSGPASAGNFGQVCDGYDSGKIDVTGSHKTLTVSAPEGQLIDGYCIKAGSVKQGLGPRYVAVDPVASLTISYPAADKNISHYALSYTKATTTTPPTTTPPTTPVPPAVDACPNMDGIQPAGTNCALPPVDGCPAMGGDQPVGADCSIPPVEICPTEDDILPVGSDCYRPPSTDACPDVPGNQHAGADCGSAPPTDHCDTSMSPADPDCVDLPTHPLVTPVVTWKNLACGTGGSYTLAGSHDGIIWTVDGKAVTEGTHPVKTAGSIVVSAAPDAPDFGLEFEAQTNWTLEFTQPKDCGELATLALTGGDSNATNVGLLFAGGLLLVGGALLIAEKKAKLTAGR